MKLKYSIGVLFITCFLCCREQPNNSTEKSGIRISEEYPNYWEYDGKPLLLLGVSDDDNLFQWKKEVLISHLDSMKKVGANYVRNTMSDRKNAGFEVYPFNQLENGKYDLNQWNNEYWNRFSTFLEETKKRNIIVQIEIWDRFDYSKEQWFPNPYNPVNNINYTYDESTFEEAYPQHPGANKQPFFFTVPDLENNELVLKFQKAFADKLLEISLKYDHVLYCMDNETSGKEEWGKFWAEYVRKKAEGKKVYMTEMWDAHNLSHKQHLRTFDHPELYDFVDISQNAWNTDFKNWEESQRVLKYLSKHSRPVNSVKIYGNDASPSKSLHDKGINTKHAISSFFRNILGGLASSRFHRPESGLGLSVESANAIKSIRKIEEKVKFWNLKPNLELLLECDENEAYAAAATRESYLVYFPKEGSVVLDMKGSSGNFSIDYLSVQDAQWKEHNSSSGSQNITLNADYPMGALVLIQKER